MKPIARQSRAAATETRLALPGSLGFYQIPPSRGARTLRMRGRSAGHEFLDVDASQVQVGKLFADGRQAHLPGSNLVARGAAEFLEPGGLLALLGGTLGVRNLCNQVHRGQHGYAALEALADLRSPLGKAELTVLPHGVTTFAAVRLKHVLGHLLLALSGCSHAVQRRRCGLRGWLTDGQGQN
jgi:hypothetical protein